MVCQHSLGNCLVMPVAQPNRVLCLKMQFASGLDAPASFRDADAIWLCMLLLSTAVVSCRQAPGHPL
jgi:hypothetical protein